MPLMQGTHGWNKSNPMTLISELCKVVLELVDWFENIHETQDVANENTTKVKPDKGLFRVKCCLNAYLNG